jgi:predicted ArsR family transcriptional regulator
MTGASLTRRFLESSRGQIVTLLRRSARTVEELATALELTDNAVRSHLATLERDGLVRQGGVRRGPGAGKPAAVYELDPAAEPLLSQAYAPVLLALLDELSERLPSAETESVLRAVGRRLAAGAGGQARGDLGARVRAGVALLGTLGGDATVEDEEGTVVIRGCACPLSAATARRPEVCRAVETLLSEVVGAPVRERCARGERPRCCFEVAVG